MRRVCRPGGRLVFVNHFDGVTGSSPMTATIGRMAAKIAGVNWHLDLGRFIRETGLEPSSIELVNLANVSMVVLCRL
jgi:hypothetical protein